MFAGDNKTTDVVHCPNCDFYYASYRPTDDEGNRLYKNYRDDFYQKQRQKYEPAYTPEFNRMLYASADNINWRKGRVASFLKDVLDIGGVRYLLDFGGDKGQFIPDVFSGAEKVCVYEISGTYVEKGVELITDYDELHNYSWDLIMCCQVLEHLSDVKSYFGNLLALMNDNTFLYIDVPLEKPTENADKRFWIHEHISFFSQHTIEVMAEQFHIRLVKAETDGKIIRALLKK